MSRVGKKSINLPTGVQVKIEEIKPAGFNLQVKGPKGDLSVLLPKGVSAELVENNLSFKVKTPDEKVTRALWGLARALTNNAIVGVTEGFSKTLEINGVGFKAALQGKKLVLNVGFSHQVNYELPAGINAEVNANQIKISGIDKQLVGQVAAEIRGIKKPEPYKGKGIKYLDEEIRRKSGKVVKTA